MKSIDRLSLILSWAILFQTNSNKPISEVLNINETELQSLITKIEKHNCNCGDSLLFDFELTVIEFEKLLSKMDKIETTILPRKMLAESYKHLSHRYYKKNIAKSHLYLDRQAQALKDIISIGKYDPSYNWAYEELTKAYQSKKSKLTDFDPKHEYYAQLIAEISSEFDAIRYSKFQLTDVMSSLLQRAKNKQLTIEDKKYIDELVLTLFNRVIDSARYRRFQDEYAIDLLLAIIENNQLDTEQIEKIRSLAIIARVRGFPYKEKELESILWWCEAKTIDDNKELMLFLNQQMLSANQEAALKMLVELGRVDEIISWSEVLEFEISYELFEQSIKLAIKKKDQFKK